MDKIVSFVCERSFPPDFPELGKDIVSKLMDPNPKTRLGGGPDGLEAVKVNGPSCGIWGHPPALTPSSFVLQRHPFFAGLDLESLHTQVPPPMAQGAAAPQPEAGWARRQNSIMLSPMPTK